MGIEKVIIIGSGPAGHTASIYTARAGLSPLMFEGEMAGGVMPGGQLTTTTHIENFPGFPESISGFDLMDRMREQSIKNGTTIKTMTVDRVDLSERPFKVYCNNEVTSAHSIIIATGATAKKLNLPGEEALWQKGVSACAVCDGGLPVFRNKHLIIVGGGDSAVEEALYLTKFASKVTMLVRRNILRASRVMQDRLNKNDKIDILWNSVPLELYGEDSLTQVKIKNIKTEVESVMDISGLFYAIGHLPNSGFLNNQIELNNTKYIKTHPGSTKTSIEGVFACGDVQDSKYRQAVTSAGTGCMAAMDVEHFLITKS
ncbi:MAG: thioredoxin-disulfide reductase [bacterium]|nr:thioredoxin-disulfide reductase [bacterium]